MIVKGILVIQSWDTNTSVAYIKVAGVSSVIFKSIQQWLRKNRKNSQSCTANKNLIMEKDDLNTLNLSILSFEVNT